MLTGFMKTSNGMDDVEISKKDITLLRHVWNSNTALRGAVHVIQSRVLDAGVHLSRNGEMVEMNPKFRKHVDSVWIPFAHECITNLVVFGICAVSIEKDPKTNEKIPMCLPLSDVKIVSRKKKDTVHSKELVVLQEGSNNVDESTMVFVYNNPSSSGNLTSPLMSVTHLVEAMDIILELAVVSEGGRARPAVVTQERPQTSSSSVQPDDMYYDSQSRVASESMRKERDAGLAQRLRAQQAACAILNRWQTSGRSTIERDIASDDGWSRRNGASMGRTGSVQSSGRLHALSCPDVGERSMALPQNQEVANVPLPQSRGDLVDIMRMVTDHVCAALGVPSSLIFDSRYAGQTREQLSLLNNTVSTIGKALSVVMTILYHATYSKKRDRKEAKARSDAEANDLHDADVDMIVVPTPMAAPQDIGLLMDRNILDMESAVPLALGAIGSSQSEADAVRDRRKKSAAIELTVLRCQAAAAIKAADEAAKKLAKEVAKEGDQNQESSARVSSKLPTSKRQKTDGQEDGEKDGQEDKDKDGQQNEDKDGETAAGEATMASSSTEAGKQAKVLSRIVDDATPSKDENSSEEGDLGGGVPASFVTSTETVSTLTSEEIVWIAEKIGSEKLTKLLSVCDF